MAKSKYRNEALIDVVNWPEWDRLMDIYEPLPAAKKDIVLGNINWAPDPVLGPREDRLLLGLRRANVYTGTPIPMPSGMIEAAIEYDEAMAAQDIMENL